MTTKHVFTSHYKKDTKKVKKLEERLKTQQSNYNVKSSTIDETKIIPSNSERTIRKELRKRINFASTVLVAVGKKTHKRAWINWEIEEAARMGKNIVGVYLHGESDSKVPISLERFGNSLVGYNNVNRIINCIEGESHWLPSRPSKLAMKDERSTC